MTGIRDYSPTAASNLSVGGISIAEGMARASVNNALRSGYADLANLLLDQGGGVSTTGSANAYLLDLPSAPTAYNDNLLFVCKLNHAITGPATININGLGVKALKKLEEGVAVPLEDGDAFAGDRPICIYSSASNAVLMLQGGGGLAGKFDYGTAGSEKWPIIDRLKQQVYLLDFIPEAEHAAIAAGTSTFDCIDAFEAAMNSASTWVENERFYVGGPEVIFPAGECYFSRTIEIKKTMTLTGQGSGHRNASVSSLRFPANITGITVNSVTGFEGDMDPPVYPVPPTGTISKGGDATIIRRLRLHSMSLGNPNFSLNTSGSGAGTAAGGTGNGHHGVGHGIWVRGACLIEHCQIQHFPQNGIYVRAAAVASDTPDGRSVYGNANLTQIYHTACLSSGGCGLYVDGPDTNACLFYGMDIAGSRSCGVFDSCLIGNTHIMPHTSDNGKGSYCSYALTPGVTQMSRYYARDPVRANGQAAKWLNATAYVVGNKVADGTKLYVCSQSGTSKATGLGPSNYALPKSAGIVDGTAKWDFVWYERIDLAPLDAVPRIPPLGHADSEAVWGFSIKSPGAVGAIDTHDDFPLFPYELDGTTLSLYRFGHNFWFDQGSGHNILIGPYIEGSQAYSLILAPNMVFGNLTYDAASSVVAFNALSNAATIRPAVLLEFGTDTRELTTRIGSLDDIEAANWLADGDHARGLAFLWNEPNGSWAFQWARSQTPMEFTTNLNTITGGRTDPLASGRVMFGASGIWVGNSETTARNITNNLAIPTTGQWAAGDLVLNSAPLLGEPWGWRCILGGDFAGTPPTFQPLRDTGSQQTIATDANFTLTPGTSPYRTLHTGTLTTNRTVTLSTSGALIGLCYRLTRTGGGAFSLNVGAGTPLKALAQNTWCEVTYDGSAYYLSAYGAL